MKQRDILVASAITAFMAVTTAHADMTTDTLIGYN